MISARGPDPSRQTGLASMSGLRCFMSLARPQPRRPCRQGSAAASNRAMGAASNSVPPGLLPSLGMAKPPSRNCQTGLCVLGATHTHTPNGSASL